MGTDPKVFLSHRQPKLLQEHELSSMNLQEKRALMARFRGKDSKPEILVRQALHRHGRRFRLHRKDLPGKPDIVLPRWRTVVFVHGCFWHAHPDCKIARVPRTNLEFWQAKFNANKLRDQEVQRALQNLGWRVVTVWECGAKSPDLEVLLGTKGLV
ncbi:MAG: very short patch repair endonuclease [Roseovarius sp.]